MKIKFNPEWYADRFGLFAEGDGSQGAEGGGGSGAGAAAAGANQQGSAAGQQGAGAQGQGQSGQGAAGQQQQAAGAAAGQQQQQGQQQAADWREAIKNPEARKLAEDSTDVNHLAERTLAMRQKLANAIIPPGKDAKPEEVAEYRKKIGVPEKPEGYVYDDPEGYVLTEADKAVRAHFAGIFHQHNIPAEAAKALATAHREVMAKQAEAILAADKEHAEKAEAALRKEWPGADYDKNKAFAQRAAKDLFGDEFDAARQIEDKAGRFVLDNPTFLKALAKIGREMGEDRLGGVVGADAIKALDEQIDGLRRQQSEAQAKGESRKANELYQQEQALIAKRNGVKPVVGAQARVA